MIHECSVAETVIKSHHELLYFLKTHFDLNNAQETFHQVMGIILYSKLWQIDVAYHDHIVAFLEIFNNHIAYFVWSTETIARYRGHLPVKEVFFLCKEEPSTPSCWLNKGTATIWGDLHSCKRNKEVINLDRTDILLKHLRRTVRLYNKLLMS